MRFAHDLSPATFSQEPLLSAHRQHILQAPTLPSPGPFSALPGAGGATALARRWIAIV